MAVPDDGPLWTREIPGIRQPAAEREAEVGTTLEIKGRAWDPLILDTVPATDASASIQRRSAGQKLKIRIKVDDLVVDPGVAVLTTNNRYETHSHLAFKTSVPPGTHRVTVEWRVSEGSAFVRNRSFTVWVEE